MKSQLGLALPQFHNNGSTVEHHLNRKHNICKDKKRNIEEVVEIVNLKELQQFGSFVTSQTGMTYHIHENPLFYLIYIWYQDMKDIVLFFMIAFVDKHFQIIIMKLGRE